MKQVEKKTHKHSVVMREAMMEFAREESKGNPYDTTVVAKMMQKFGITHSDGHYWHRKAFNLYRGQRYPKTISITAETSDQLKALVDAGHFETTKQAVEVATNMLVAKIQKVY